MGNITDAYRQHACTQPDKPAIIMDDQQVSYQTWEQRINQTANWLDHYQLRPDQKPVIAFLLPNGLPFLQLFAGAARAGWVAVPLDEKWTAQEIETRLALAKPAVVIAAQHNIANQTESLTLAACLEAISRMPIKRAAVVCSQNLPFYMGFTSGTTGRPKAFLRSHDSWVASFICSVQDFGMDGAHQVLIPGALVHSHFLYGAINTLHTGGTIVLMEKFSSHIARAWLESGDITAVYVVPTMIEAFMREGLALSQPVIAVSSGAKWQEASKQQMRKVGLIRYELYGASELSFVTVMAEADVQRKQGSVGRACTGVEIEIRRQDGSLASVGEAGKIFVRSALLFDGYIDLAGRLETITGLDGFATVDDMGYLDDDGYLYIVGREKNMILYGALNIFPEEIERVLMRHPHVMEVAVIGMPNTYWGEIAVAVIKGNATKLALQRWCKHTLAAYKIPRKWYYVQEMPYTTSGKVARATLKAMLEEGEIQ